MNMPPPHRCIPLILDLYGDFTFKAYSFIPVSTLVVIVFVTIVSVTKVGVKKRIKAFELSYCMWKLNWPCTHVLPS